MLDYFIIQLFICIYMKVGRVCSKFLILKSYIIRFNNCDVGHDVTWMWIVTQYDGGFNFFVLVM